MLSFDDGKQRVEIMRHSTGQLSERFHFLRLTELFLKPRPFGFILLQRLPHTIKSQSYLGNFAADLRLQMVIEVAFLQSVHTLYQSAERTSECMGDEKR